MIRLATFNIENLFTRPTAMNQDTDAAGREAIEDHAIANNIAKKEIYSDSEKATHGLAQRAGNYAALK